MSEQEKLLYNLVKDFVHAARNDYLDTEDWPYESWDIFHRMKDWASNN